jgi:hypothetical protein
MTQNTKDAGASEACPFCGSANISAGEVLSSNPDGGASTQSMCRDCGALGPDAHLRAREMDYGDIKATVAWNRRAPTAEQTADKANTITLDRRDLFDFVRGAIKGALEDASNEAHESGEPMRAADCWSDAHTRTEVVFDKLGLGDVAPTAEQAEGVRVVELEREIADLKAGAEKKAAQAAELGKMLANIIHDQTVAMQAAIIEWQHGKGAEAGFSWIVNTLEGPGHLPDFDEPYGKQAQFWFDANRAEPFPKCFCGNPSHQLWMGQGFCCNEHYVEAKAKHDAAPASSTGYQENSDA